MRIAEEDGRRWRDAGEPLSAVSVIDSRGCGIRASTEPALRIFEVLAKLAIGDLNALELLFGFERLRWLFS